MGIVVDTNVLIDAEKDHLDLRGLDAFSEYGDAYLAAITVSELLIGVHLAKATDIRIRRSAFAEGIIARIPVLDFDESVARSYAELYAHFLKPRAKLATNVHDLQIAATCIAHGFAVLTSNVADYRKVPGLQIVEPWP
ncbi:MAG: type II toxin-antitoxin system VapC family toxin [Pseudomonadota bacterium]|nr:type II toxin-antitoxin system VapC family toxin [Pseudomonadota bacterium]